MLTLSPRSLSRRPRLDAVKPLPRLEATPPVTNRCLVETGRDAYGGVAKMKLPWSVPAIIPPVHGPSGYQAPASTVHTTRAAGVAGA